MRLDPGSRLGPYEITGSIGAGGMGEVYRARDTRLGREVALKVLPPEVTRDPERLARFEREARSASALNHRNIVTVHDFDSLDGEMWLVMELVRGGSLRDVLARAPLPLKELFSIASGIADGLAAAHAAGLVHRDLKPENVGLTSDGTPKILDFGLVKHAPIHDAKAETEVQMSRSGMVIGTATYMSPEQARGEPVDFRTDHFAFGLILYELASGKHPFLRPTPIETLAAILNEEPEPLCDSLPEPFVEIVGRCLAKTPAERYGSTADLAHDLRRLRDSGTGSIPRQSRAPRPRRWALAGGLALAAIALVAGWIAWRGRSAPSAGSIHAEVATPEIAEVYAGEVQLPVTISPDGRYLVVQGNNAEGAPILALHDLRTGAIRVLAENAVGAGWSTDSTAVAFFADGKLKTAAIDGSPPRTVCDALPEGTPAWQGETILFFQYSQAPGMYRVDSAGGEPQRVTDLTEFSWWPEFFPDGNHFLYLMFKPPGDQRKVISHDLMLGSLDGSPSRKISGQLDSRAVFADGFLLYVRDGTLLAQPFDPDDARFTGDAKPLLDGLHYFRSTGNAAFSVSRNGIIAWRSAQHAARLVWLDRSGLELESVATAPFVGAGRLSPDGTHYAVGVTEPRHGAADVWTYDLSRQSAERLTFRLHDEKAPVWAPDGATLYYRSDGRAGPPDIARFRLADGTSDWAYAGPSVEEPHDASRDGKWLLFVDYTTPGGDIKVLPLNPPGPPRPFVATPFNESSPRFSPDGRRVAFQSDASGRPEIYVRAFDGSSQVRISKDGGTRPRWAADGRELYFLGDAGRLMAVAIDPAGAPSTPRILFQAPGTLDFDVAPDGQRFLVQLDELAADPPVHLLINWRARLESE